MNKKNILVLYTSPTQKIEAGSTSTYLTKEYLNILKEKEVELNIKEVNLNEITNKRVLTDENLANGTFFNKESDKLIEMVKSYDILVIALPMINFNVPAVFKNFIDSIAVANKTFKYKYDGSGESIGLLDRLTVQIIATQGASVGWYPFGDHVAYTKGTLEFLGMKVLDPILGAGTKTPMYEGKEKLFESLRKEFENSAETIAKM